MLLQEGDVIYLSIGQTIYTEIPEMFVYDNRRASQKLIKSAVDIGKKYKSRDLDKPIEKVAEGVKERFSWEGFDISIEEARSFVENKVNKLQKEMEYMFEPGEFVIVKTCEDGGSYGRDSYPSGHHVFIKRLKNGKFDSEGQEANFYQTGCFTAMIKDVIPVRKMENKSVFVESFV